MAKLAALALAAAALLTTPAAAQESVSGGFLARPSVAEVIGARSYDDLVIVVYNVDYDDVADLPPAADAWWVDGQDGTSTVASAAPVAYVRDGWGNGVIALSAESITQVTLRGMPGRYAEPLAVTAPVTAGSSLGGDLLLALKGLEDKPEWADQEMVDGDWLGGDGTAYAERLVPDLRELAPEIYSARILELERVSATVTPRNDQGILEVEALSHMTGAAARTLHLPETMFRLVATVILALIAAALAVKASGSGLMAIPAITVVMLGGTLIGFVDLALMLSLAFLAAVVVGFALFGKRA